jgi:ABC-type branched-subunit amino acid transport system ATPase component
MLSTSTSEPPMSEPHRDERDSTLEVDSLAVSFGAAQVLRTVSVSVGSGEVVGLVGPNGARKTTTLRTVSGVSVLSTSASSVLLAPQSRRGAAA